jgi:Flp pilus assembly pilin Flp
LRESHGVHPPNAAPHQGGAAACRTRHDAGQAMPEYVLILALIALVVIVGMLFLAGNVGSFDVFKSSDSRSGAMRPPAQSRGGCNPNYSGACIPPPPPDLDCSDLQRMGVGTVRIVGSDPHHLDPDHDGIACD